MKHRQSQYSHSQRLGVFILAAFVVIMLISCIGVQVHFNLKKEVVTARVLTTAIKRIDDEDRYLVSIERVDDKGVATAAPETVKIEDSILYGNFRSADVYFDLTQHTQAIYVFTLLGTRNGYLSTFPNIVEYRYIKD